MFRYLMILLAFCVAPFAVAQTDEPASAEFLRSHGFVLIEPNLVCSKFGGSDAVIKHRPGMSWYTLCEGGINSPSYVGVLNRARSSPRFDMQKDFGNNFMRVTNDPGSRSINCKRDPTKDVVTGLDGEAVDCILSPGTEGQRPMYFTVFYFSPSGESWGKAIVFSDFGRGDKDHEGFKASVRARIAKNLKAVK